MDDTAEPKSVNAYQHDTLESIYNELKAGEAMIYSAAQLIMACETDEAVKRSTYEDFRNKYVREMYQEEADPKSGVKKRTEEQRRILYRIKYRAQRLAWQEAIGDTKASYRYLDALQSIQTSIESRANILKIDERFAGSKYT